MERIKVWLAGLLKFAPKNWREIIAWIAVASVASLVGRLTGDKPFVPPPPIPLWERPPDGYVLPTEEQMRDALAALPNPYFADTEAGKAEEAFFADVPEAFLWKASEKGASRPIRVINQGQYGTCVGCASAKGLEMRLAMQSLLRRGPPQSVPEINVAYVYAVGRIDGNGGKLPPTLRGGDGSFGGAAVRGMQSAGSLDAAVHGSFDLTKYDGALCRKWGDVGPPKELRDIAKPNKLATFAQVKSTAELKKALLQGYPVLTCSQIGFDNPTGAKPNRDKDGFLREYSTWAHAMLFVGYRESPRPSFCVWNSWGEDWCTGPVGYGDCPKWCFWVDVPTAARMVGEGRSQIYQDTWAIAGVDGFRKKKLVPSDWIVDRRPEPLNLFGVRNAFLP